MPDAGGKNQHDRRSLSSAGTAESAWVRLSTGSAAEEYPDRPVWCGEIASAAGRAFSLWAGGTVQSPHGTDVERRLRRGSWTAGECGAAGNARRSAGRGTGTVPAARHCAYSVRFGLPCGRAGCLAGAADDAGEASAASDGADIADAAGVCVPDRRKCARRPRRAALGARLLGSDSPQAGADAACAVRIGNDSADVLRPHSCSARRSR